MNSSENEKLTFWEASSIVAGYGIGGGVMAVPYLASLVGIYWVLTIVFAAFIVSVLLHLMIAEMFMRDGKTGQLLELFGKYLFKGTIGKLLLWVFFFALTISMIANLAAYVVGSGDIITSLLGLPQYVSQLLFYVLAAGVVFFGLKAIGVCEKIAVAGIGIIMVVLTIATFFVPFHDFSIEPTNMNRNLALLGMVMFSFAAFFSVPQAVKGLSWKKELAPRAVVAGISINLGIVLLVTVLSLAVSNPVTEIAMVGWSKAIGDWANIAGSIFVLLAMVTSYWSISMAMTVILKERLHWGDKASWLTATLPSLAIALIGFAGFLGYMRVAGGIIGILIAFMVIPCYRAVRKAFKGSKADTWNLGLYGNWPFQLLVLVGYLLMGIGSSLPIK